MQGILIFPLLRHPSVLILSFDPHLEHRPPPQRSANTRALLLMRMQNAELKVFSFIFSFIFFFFLQSDLTKEQNGFKITLKTLEDNLLSRLSSASGNFLGDTELVENLEVTKRTAAEIEEKVCRSSISHLSGPAADVVFAINFHDILSAYFLHFDPGMTPIKVVILIFVTVWHCL